MTPANLTLRQRREKLYALLGDLPDRHSPFGCRIVDSREHDGYRLETLELDLNGQEPVPAYFAKPLDAGTAKLPTVLYHHSHGGNYTLGKEELIVGHEGVLTDPPPAKALTQAGYGVLCIDAWCFGKRHHTPEHDVVKAFLWQGRVLWGAMVFDALRALDYLHTREDVDRTRIATFGMSMGSSVAQWVAALDERIKVCAHECGLVDYRALLDAKALSQHNFYYYVPQLLKHFSAPDILSMIAPRAHMACVGNQDLHAPLDGVERIDTRLRGVYAAAGVSAAWQLSKYDCGHTETPAMREDVLAFIKKWINEPEQKPAILPVSAPAAAVPPVTPEQD